MIPTGVIVLDHVCDAPCERFAQLLESSEISESELEVWMSEFESSLEVSSHASVFLVRALTDQLDESDRVSSSDIGDLVESSKDDRQEVSDKDYRLSDSFPDSVDYETFYEYVCEVIDLSDLEVEYSPASSDRFGLRLG